MRKGWKREEVSRYFFGYFLSDNAQIFRRRPFYFVKIFGYRKLLCLRWLLHDFCRNFFVSWYRRTLQENSFVLWFRKFPVSEKFIDKSAGREGLLRFSVENSFSHSAEKFRKGNLSVSLNSRIENF